MQFLKKIILKLFWFFSPVFRKVERNEQHIQKIITIIKQSNEEDKILRNTIDLLHNNINDLNNDFKVVKKNIENQFQKNSQELNNYQKQLSDLFALILSNRDNQSNPIISEIMRKHASFPPIIGKQLPIYGQTGEDLMVEYILWALNRVKFEQNQITYLDIGANHPINTSNTYRFYKRGMRGVLVEPIPFLVEELKRIRPQDTILPIGIKFDERDEAVIYVSDHHEISSFNKQFIEDFVDRGQKEWDIENEIKVELKSINLIIKEYCNDQAPDFLDIDVESYDYEILTSINYEKYRPLVICIEPSNDYVKPEGYTSNSDRIQEFMKQKEYILWARTRINLIFVDKKKIN